MYLRMEDEMDSLIRGRSIVDSTATLTRSISTYSHL